MHRVGMRMLMASARFSGETQQAKATTVAVQGRSKAVAALSAGCSSACVTDPAAFEPHERGRAAIRTAVCRGCR